MDGDDDKVKISVTVDNGLQEEGGNETILSPSSTDTEVQRSRMNSNQSESSLLSKSGARILVQEQVTKHPKFFLTMEFNPDGTTRVVELPRTEVLKAARKDLSRGESGKGWTKSRDIRTLDSGFSISHAPVIVVRRGAVMLNLEPLRAMVLRDRCYVFIPEGADSILSILIKRLGAISTDEQGIQIPFEFRAYEAIFTTVTNIVEQEFQILEPDVLATISSLVHASTGATLEVLRQSKNKVSKLLNRVEGIQHAFMAILDSDPDLVLMNLTSFYKHPDLYSEQNLENRSHEDTEFLFEAYLQRVDATLSQLRLLTLNIESVESMVMLRLDYARNHLMRIDLILSSMTSAAAVGALVFGAFGMNLKSDIEAEDNWFLGTTLSVFLGGFLACLVFLGYIFKAGLLST